jgi:hypothetical protein
MENAIEFLCALFFDVSIQGFILALIFQGEIKFEESMVGGNIYLNFEKKIRKIHQKIKYKIIQSYKKN